MKIEEWPNFITVKTLQLEAQAKTLAAQGGQIRRYEPIQRHTILKDH